MPSPGGVFEIEEAERREAVPEVLFDVHKVVEHLELAVLLHAAYFELVVEGFCQPHFRVGFCNGVVHESVEVFDVFRGPASYELSLGVFAPADANPRCDCLVFLLPRSVAGHDDFEHRPVLEEFFTLSTG